MLPLRSAAAIYGGRCKLDAGSAGSYLAVAREALRADAAAEEAAEEEPASLEQQAVSTQVSHQ